jgi:hypothetical protein
MTDPTLDELKAELAAQKARIDELERKAKPEPPKPFKSDHVYVNPIDRLSMPPDAMADMVRVTGSDLMRDLREDARRNSTLKPLGGEPPARERGTGWQTPAPLGNPEGVALADRLMIAADAKERAEKIVADPEALAKWKEGRK